MALSFFVKYIAKDIEIAIYEICVLKYLLENFLDDRGFEKLKLESWYNFDYLYESFEFNF